MKAKPLKDSSCLTYIKVILILLTPVCFSDCLNLEKVTDSVRIDHGSINGVFINRKGENLVIYGDPNDKIKKADLLLFTHMRRDVVSAGNNLVKYRSKIVVPAYESDFFRKPDSLWSNYAKSRFHDYGCQTTKFGINPYPGATTVKGGEILKWKDLNFKVISTPGYTRGSVSYLADIDGKRYAFTGDLIYDNGKILDLYSFQDTLQKISGYHGYAARLSQLIYSLKTIALEKPDLIVPARGPVISNPQISIQTLIQRIQDLYKNYYSISAYHWYYPERMDIFSSRILGSQVPVERTSYAFKIQKTTPSWFYHFNVSNLVFSKDSSAFLIDCGTSGAVNKLHDLKKSGRLKKLDGIFITHYHDDHVDFINQVADEFNCPVYATEELQNILENPGAFKMPCLTTDPIRNLTTVRNGQKLNWKDFTLTFFYFPGQTLYHDAVLFEENGGESVFFTGDSFTPSGIDDYCLLNRNLLNEGTGYFQCLEILKKLPENVFLSNQHVEPLFAFSPSQLDTMENVLLRRKTLLKDLFQWDNVNFGIDEQWCRIYPYVQKAGPGDTLRFAVKITNHSEVKRKFKVEPVIPDGFFVYPEVNTVSVGPLKEGEVFFDLRVPEQFIPGISLVTINIGSGKQKLLEWCETLIEAKH